MLNIYEDDFHTHVTHSSHSALYESFFWQDYGQSQIRDPNVTCQIQGTSFNRKKESFQFLKLSWLRTIFLIQASSLNTWEEDFLKEFFIQSVLESYIQWPQNVFRYSLSLKHLTKILQNSSANKHV